MMIKSDITPEMKARQFIGRCIGYAHAAEWLGTTREGVFELQKDAMQHILQVSGWSVRELARRLKWSHQYMWLICSGQRAISPQVATDLAALWGEIQQEASR